VPIYSSVSSGAVVKCAMGMVQLQVLRDDYVVLCIVPRQVENERESISAKKSTHGSVDSSLKVL